VGRASAVVTFAAAAVIAGCTSSSTVLRPPTPLHSIQHVVILMQENRSFNTIFAGFPGAMTAMTGKCKPARWCKTGTIGLTSVPLESTGNLGLGKDIDHSHHGFEIECDLDSSGICRNDGFDKIGLGESGGQGPAGHYPYKYVERSEVKAYWDFAKQYALADRMFFTDTASSFISHQVILSGTVRLNSTESLTDQPDDQRAWGCDAVPGTQVPILLKDGREIYAPHKGLPFPCFTQYGTIADLLDAANIPWRYYVSGLYGDFSGDVWDGFDAIAKVRCAKFTPPEHCSGDGADWKTHVVNPNTKVFNDVKNGTLPAVSWVIPTLEDSDHPASGCNHGPHWVTSVINAIGESNYWDSTAVVLLWDDWGGWYDPVTPPQINYTSLGFRVPMVVVSPWARANTVAHTQYQFGSILKFIEETFGLGSLHTTDATSNSIGDIFNFSQKPTAYVPEPLPKQAKCVGGASARQMIEHDGGVPE
jgi:phospholipase C